MEHPIMLTQIKIDNTMPPYLVGSAEYFNLKASGSEDLASWLEEQGRYAEAAAVYDKCSYLGHKRQARCGEGYRRCVAIMTGANITLADKVAAIRTGLKAEGADIGAVEQENGAIETWDLRGINSTLDGMMDDESLWSVICDAHPCMRNVPESGF